MTKNEATTISFIGNIELKNWLARKAEREDRSISSVIRSILESIKKVEEIKEEHRP